MGKQQKTPQIDLEKVDFEKLSQFLGLDPQELKSKLPFFLSEKEFLTLNQPSVYIEQIRKNWIRARKFLDMAERKKLERKWRACILRLIRQAKNVGMVCEILKLTREGSEEEQEVILKGINLCQKPEEARELWDVLKNFVERRAVGNRINLCQKPEEARELWQKIDTHPEKEQAALKWISLCQTYEEAFAALQELKDKSLFLGGEAAIKCIDLCQTFEQANNIQMNGDFFLHVGIEKSRKGMLKLIGLCRTPKQFRKVWDLINSNNKKSKNETGLNIFEFEKKYLLLKIAHFFLKS